MVDLADATRAVERLLREASERYRQLHESAGAAEYPPVDAVTIFLSFGESELDKGPYLAAHLDTRLGAPWDGEYSHEWFHEVPVPQLNLGDDDYDTVGPVVVEAASNAVANGTCATLPRTAGCRLYVMGGDGDFMGPPSDWGRVEDATRLP